MQYEDFLQVVQHGWSIPTNQTDKAKALTAKFKNLRRVLKAWQQQISSLANRIKNTKLILSLMEILEEFRDLSIAEWNFKNILGETLEALLHQQRIYRRQRGTIKWVCCGDEGTKFFHANATVQHRRNLITSLVDTNGTACFTHQEKAELLWTAYKERLGTSEPVNVHFDLEQLFERATNLGCLEDPFSKEEIDEVVTKKGLG